MEQCMRNRLAGIRIRQISAPASSTPRSLAAAGAATLMAVVLSIGSAIPAWAGEAITVTLVRHGESVENVTGNTSDPDTPLTPAGVAQANAVAQLLATSGVAYDGVYASKLQRTQQTAQPLADLLNTQVVDLAGLNEIDPGLLTGFPEKLDALAYLVVGAAWLLGDRYAAIPGSVDGNQFANNYGGAMQTIYDSGDQLPVAYSSAAATMLWVTMTVKNPEPLLIVTSPLSNTSVVVVNGDPEDGWTLVSWNGISVDPNPSLLTKLYVDTRTLIVAPQTSLYNIGQALKTGNVTTIVNAVKTAAIDVANAVTRFPVAVAGDIAEAVRDALPRAAGTTSIKADTAQITKVVPAVAAPSTTTPRPNLATPRQHGPRESLGTKDQVAEAVSTVDRTAKRTAGASPKASAHAGSATRHRDAA
jgi:broad specificity phosphatase PhoE